MITRREYSLLLETIKIHINSTISRAKKGARYLCIDIGNNMYC
jgi:hypothetical protein